MAFLVACISAYSMSFVYDIIVQACVDRLPYENIISPVFTWLSIACTSFYIASHLSTRKLALMAPFIISGLLAISVIFSFR